MLPLPPISTLFPYTTLFRSHVLVAHRISNFRHAHLRCFRQQAGRFGQAQLVEIARKRKAQLRLDRKSTRLNSSHVAISYAVFCLKKKKKEITKDNNVLNTHL